MALNNTISLIINYSVSGGIDEGILLSNGVEMEITKNVSIPNAYIKIIYLQGSKEKMHITVGFYSDVEASNLIYSKHYDFLPDVNDPSENFIKQAYEYLKTLPEFEGAVDVLEEGQML